MDLINSKTADPQIFKIISVLAAALELKQAGIIFEETRCDGKFIYFLENKKRNISGYIGRDKEKNKITYVATDFARIQWALTEGFTRDEAFERAGVLMRLKGIDDAIIYFSGGKDYTVVSRFSMEKPVKEGA